MQTKASMNKFKPLMTLTAAVACIGASQAQDAQIPREITGRWTMQSTGRSQTFVLEEITVSPDKTFRARLTWWTSDPKCLIKNEPIVGLTSADGINFDAKNKCDVSFTAKLTRGKSEWIGTATTTSGPLVVLDLKAN